MNLTTGIKEYHENLHMECEKYQIKRGPYSERPGNPGTGQLYFDTDRGLIFHWDGTRWLSASEYVAQFPRTTSAATFTLQVEVPAVSIYATQIQFIMSQVNAGSAVNYWDWSGVGAFSPITLIAGAVRRDTQTILAGTATGFTYTIAQLGSNPSTASLARELGTFTLNGAPGALTLWGTMRYRLVG